MVDIPGEHHEEKLPTLGALVAHTSKKCCSTSKGRLFLPILDWLPKYKAKFLLQDIIAGLTVGLTAIPQAIAYGIVAGLPPQYGLYSAFMGCFVYIFFGTSKDITVGPTAIMALMIQTHALQSPDYAVLSCFLAGCTILLMGALNLGVLVQFISMPVVTGFTAAAAITIGSGQINNLFGIKSSSNEFIASWANFFTYLSQTRLNDALLGVCTLILLLLMQKLKDMHCGHKVLLKYVSLSRNAMAVVIGTLICFLLSTEDSSPFRVSGEITPGIPSFKLPPFGTNVNGTEVNFSQMLSDLGTSVLSIPLISVLESIAIAKAFSKGKIVNASQEMIALGLCNIAGSFFSSMPVTGSFTRTAINNASGVKTPLGGAVTGALVLMSLAFLTKTFYYIPKATLAAIIIAAMIFMVDHKRIVQIWRSKKLDIIPLIVTVTTCLFWSLEYGIVCGIIVNVLFILYRSARPRITIRREKIDDIIVGLVEVHDNLNYSSAEYLQTKIIKFKALQNVNIRVIVIKGSGIGSIDSTVALNILTLKQDLAVLGCDLICWNWNQSAVGVICRLDNKISNMFKFDRELNLQDDIRTQNRINMFNNVNNGIIH